MERRLHRLDRIDEQILAILKQEGRISYQKLAERVHLTPRPCQERVRKLEQAGYILGYTARLDEARLGGGNLILLLQVSLASQSGREAQRAFEEEVSQRPDVLSCWLVSGPFDYVLRLRCTDMAAYRAISDGWLANRSLRIDKIVCTPEMQPIK